MRTFFKSLFPLLLCLLILGCKGKPVSNEIRVGTITGPETRLMEVARDVAAKQSGIIIKIVEFNDYTMPNAALSDGSIDANMFQHQPYLDQTIKARRYKLVSIGKTFIYPMGIYSKKIRTLQRVPMNATVAIPNDPSNEARALLLLAKAGLIELKPGADITATTKDVKKNLKNLQFKELDAAQIARALPDVDLAVINTNYAIPAKLTPSKNALFLEDTSSPYANIVVVRKSERNDPRFKALMSALYSQDVLFEAIRVFNGQAIPAWRQYGN